VWVCSLFAPVDPASGDSKNRGAANSLSGSVCCCTLKEKKHRGAASLLCGRPTNASSPFDFLCHISKDH